MAKRITWADRENNPAKSLLGVNYEAPATIYNTLKEKANNPGKKISFPVSDTTVTVNADDEFYFSDYTQTGVLNFEAEAGLPQNVGVGNGITGIIISNGDDITFSSDFNVTYPATFEAGESYYLNLFWNGVKFQGIIQKVGEIADNQYIETPIAMLFVDATNGNDTTGDGTRGKPLATIAEAITQATPGTTIYIYPGVYTNTLTVDVDNLTFVGVGSFSLGHGSAISIQSFQINIANNSGAIDTVWQNINIISFLLGFTQSSAVNNNKQEFINCSLDLNGISCSTLILRSSGMISNAFTISDTMEMYNSSYTEDGTATIDGLSTGLTAINSYIDTDINITGDFDQNNTTVTGSIAVSGTQTVNNQYVDPTPLKQHKQTLTQAQIQSLNTSRVQLNIPDDPAKEIVIENIFVKLNHEGTDFSGGSKLQIEHFSGTSTIIGETPTDFISANSDRTGWIYPISNITTSLTSYWVTADADSTGGDASTTIDIWVNFRQIEFP